MTLTISGSNIGGLLFGVQDANKNFVGGLKAPTTGSFKVCGALGAGSGMSITHGLLNTLTTLDISFTPPAGTIGPLTVSALVSTGTVHTPYGTASLTLSSSSGAAGGSSTTATGAGKTIQSPAPSPQSSAPVATQVHPSVAPAPQSSALPAGYAIPPSAAPFPFQSTVADKTGCVPCQNGIPIKKRHVNEDQHTGYAGDSEL
ncbi:hypothetical protein SmJEL517_g06164 [Synchytrium microbalum]|uniref:Uncharacterized protein n=1 Tax=Synchytrium microbalum TaxID=1806994 RepID=A0A507BJX6_9FUNG|nr:uncharacterized protein SmJEL517_g06164 [Synchytrium microbalum]TPX30227.1 hypothetical protein SmJEL517_g06164 [Synchytrium microbalum]